MESRKERYLERERERDAGGEVGKEAVRGGGEAACGVGGGCSA